MSEGIVEATLLDRAPRKQGDDRLIRLVAGITAAPGRALLQIAAQLEACTSVCRVAERGGNLSGICSLSGKARIDIRPAQVDPRISR